MRGLIFLTQQRCFPSHFSDALASRGAASFRAGGLVPLLYSLASSVIGSDELAERAHQRSIDISPLSRIVEFRSLVALSTPTAAARKSKLLFFYVLVSFKTA
jgi:hypothetical protein